MAGQPDWSRTTTRYLENTDLVSSAYRDPILGAGATYTVLNREGRGQLLAAELCSDTDDAAVRLTIDGTVVMHLVQGNAPYEWHSISLINSNCGDATAFWKIQNFDAVGSNYLMLMQTPFYFYDSLKIEIKNGGAGVADVQAAWTYRVKS